MKLKKHAIQAASLSLVTIMALSIAEETVQAAMFTPPSDNSAPSQSTGGASRSSFLPPSDNSAPSQSTGGASRSRFLPPSDNSAPSQSTGGASRSSFLPPSDNSAPSQSTGGASRQGFTPPSDNSAPSQAAGGASRGSFIPPSDNSSPSQAAGGAARSEQNYLEQSAMVAVLPENFYGTTLSSHPMILVYVPESPGGEGIFSLKDEDKTLLYTTSIPVSGKGGILAIQLPEDAPELEVGKLYQWYFALKLDQGLSPNTPFVDGLVKRIAPSSELARSLEGKTRLQQSSILAENGVWYDCAAILAALQVVDPTNSELVAEWTELLDSVNLSKLTKASLIPTAY